MHDGDSETAAQSYCRAIEAYLCRKNDGHIIRIVGPAFEQVCGWAAQGVPLKVAFSGIDRCFQRYYAKGRRRRPVRVEFCEPDVLDVFDEWRRALGLTGVALHRSGTETAGSGSPEQEVADPPPDEHRRHRDSLSAHVERALARLTVLRVEHEQWLGGAVESVIGELEPSRGGVKSLRGAARQALIERLRALDAVLMNAARAHCDGDVIRQLEAEADSELSPFRQRMAAEAYGRSRAACVDRLLRERTRLPVLTYGA